MALAPPLYPGFDALQRLHLLPEQWQGTGTRWRSDRSPCIHMLFIIMWATGTTPDAWKNSFTTLLWKGKMAETHIKGYRPIALLNTIYKLWTKMHLAVSICSRQP